MRCPPIDALRGLAVVAMLLVNFRIGGGARIYAALQHQRWPTVDMRVPPAADWVFPLFLFVAGFGLVEKFSFYRQLKLFCCGLGLNILSTMLGAHLRLPGVLQRIAICCCVSYSIIGGLTSGKTENNSIRFYIARALIAILLLNGAWIWLTVADPMRAAAECSNIEWIWPGIPAQSSDVICSAQSHWDRLIVGDSRLHIPAKMDPEGVLSTLPACTSVIFGMIAGAIIKHGKLLSLFNRNMVLLLCGLVLMVGGWLLPIPVGKTLWTPAFALFTSGVSFIMLAVTVEIMENVARLHSSRGLASSINFVMQRLVRYGRASLKIYVISEILRRCLGSVYLTLPDDLIAFTDAQPSAVDSRSVRVPASQWIPLMTLGRLFIIADIGLAHSKLLSFLWSVLMAWMHCALLA